MKNFLSMVIGTMIGAILAIAVLLGVYKFTVIYTNATVYATTDQMTLTAARYIRPEYYKELREDYEFIVGIPFIGETL